MSYAICILTHHCIYTGWGQAHWGNLKKLSDIMESIEKQSNKKYDALGQVSPQSCQVTRSLNEMEVV